MSLIGNPLSGVSQIAKAANQVAPIVGAVEATRAVEEVLPQVQAKQDEQAAALQRIEATQEAQAAALTQIAAALTSGAPHASAHHHHAVESASVANERSALLEKFKVGSKPGLTLGA